MDNLRKSIETIFNHTNPDNIFSDLFNDSDKGILSKKQFMQQAFGLFLNYSHNEIENVYLKLKSDWLKNAYQGQESELSIFNLLIHFNKQVLTERGKEPFVRFHHLLRWRELSFAISEDLLTCSYFAYMDNRSKRRRDYFSWRPILFSTNNRLKKMLILHLLNFT